MDKNIYAAPKSDTQVQGAKKGSAFKAISIGSVIYIVGNRISLIGFLVLYGAYMSSKGMNTGEIENVLRNIESLSAIGIIIIGVDLMISILGGYICSRITNYNEYKYSAILAVVVCLSGFAMKTITDSIVERITILIISFIAVMGGAYLHNRNKTHEHVGNMKSKTTVTT